MGSDPGVPERVPSCNKNMVCWKQGAGKESLNIEPSTETWV